VRNFRLQLAATSIIAAVTYLLGFIIPAKWFFNSYVWIDLLFVLVTYSFHLGLVKSHSKGGKHFIRYYIGATGAKLFFFLMLIIVYALLNKEEAVSYALAFFYFYFIFTVFEVKTAYGQFGRNAQELPIKE
jgi:hypothetical protein